MNLRNFKRSKAHFTFQKELLALIARRRYKDQLTDFPLMFCPVFPQASSNLTLKPPWHFTQEWKPRYRERNERLPKANEASVVAQTVKNLPAMQETCVGSLGQEDPLKKPMATHSSILAWRIPWTEEPDGLQPMGSQRAGHDLTTNTTGWKSYHTNLWFSP